MKKTKWMVLALLAVCITAPAFAQSNREFQQAIPATPNAAMNNSFTKLEARKLDSIQVAIEKARVYYQHKLKYEGASVETLQENIDRTLKSIEKSGKLGPKAVETLKDFAAKEQDKRKALELLLLLAAKYDIDVESEVPTCVYCGKEIKEAYQHCSAKDGIGLCSAEKEEERSSSSSTTSSTCPNCGETLSIDQRYHGVSHDCKGKAKSKAATEAEAEYCIYCGEQIFGSYQHCKASGYTTLCTVSCPDCGRNLRDKKNLTKDGVHHCNLDKRTRIKPVEIKK